VRWRNRNRARPWLRVRGNYEVCPNRARTQPRKGAFALLLSRWPPAAFWVRSSRPSTCSAAGEYRCEAGRPAAEIAARLNPPTQPLLNADQAAALLNVPASWRMSEARASRVPHVKLGKYTRFSCEELFAWIDSRTVGPKR
jgi:hypothetical protein